MNSKDELSVNANASEMSYFPDYVQLLGATVAYIGLFTATFTTANATLSQKFEVYQTESAEKN